MPATKQQIRQIIADNNLNSMVDVYSLLRGSFKDILQELMETDEQLRFVTNSQSGMGLLKYGSVVIPFDNQIEKDMSLYKLFNTNIHEKIAEQRAKKIMLR